jgi:hypothetical protein
MFSKKTQFLVNDKPIPEYEIRHGFVELPFVVKYSDESGLELCDIVQSPVRIGKQFAVVREDGETDWSGVAVVEPHYIWEAADNITKDGSGCFRVSGGDGWSFIPRSKIARIGPPAHGKYKVTVPPNTKYLDKDGKPYGFPDKGIITGAFPVRLKS